MKRIQDLLVALCMVASAAEAAAPVPQNIKVETGDLDLGSDKGQRILAMRIQRAAKALCKSQAVASLPHNIRDERACIRQAQASTAAAVAALTAAAGRAPDRGG